MQTGCVETGLQLFSRLNNRLSVETLDQNLFPNRLKNGETVEISGNVSSGKTFFATQLLAGCILPSNTKDSIPIEGQNAGAILIDTDHHFRRATLEKIMHEKILQSYKSVNKVPTDEIVNQIIKSSLDNLTIISCYDRLQFRLSVMSLENMLLHNQKVALVVIDGIANFYWIDRDQDNIWYKDSYLKYVLSLVQKYTTNLHKVCLVYTIPSNFMPSEKEYSTWSTIEITDHRINLVGSNNNIYYGAIKSRNCEQRIFRYEITESGWKMEFIMN